ncbi:hypothetical protein PIB30_076402 [Stylosanthes scabra]|uniref:Uncharacterized protein n=1 Tax=Stylosanthes scabra TaxID=79078 RepID=A0ABU6SS56_9FABA|nr:hypothetical protein [Stylosanthes scabra]
MNIRDSLMIITIFLLPHQALIPEVPKWIKEERGRWEYANDATDMATLDMSAETPWKDDTENLREVPRLSVEAYAYAWPGNSGAPRITPRTQVYAWNIMPRHGQASSSAQNSSLGVEHHA